MPVRLIAPLLQAPVVRRLRWYSRRARGQVNRRFVLAVAGGIAAFALVASLIITLIEKPLTLDSFAQSFYWGVTMIFGQGDAGYVTSPGGWLVSWLLILTGVALLGIVTGALVALVVDFLIKEGQGLGAAGYRDHIVVCGWNSTARDLIEELRGDDYPMRVVLIGQLDRNPAGEGVYFVQGDPTRADDLRRTGIDDAAAALVFPYDRSDEADMRSILTIMAIESAAPSVRTVAEVNNPAHVEHFHRAHVDEVLVTSRLASRLLARSALYPGLTGLVTDIVSGGEGSELYRVKLPETYLGLSIDEVSSRLRTEHRATLLAISRAGTTYTNPPADFLLQPDDDGLVVAESLGKLAPLQLERGQVTPDGTYQGPDRRRPSAAASS
jgi:voltage-gated potassium channel